MIEGVELIFLLFIGGIAWGLGGHVGEAILGELRRWTRQQGHEGDGLGDERGRTQAGQAGDGSLSATQVADGAASER